MSIMPEIMEILEIIKNQQVICLVEKDSDYKFYYHNESSLCTFKNQFK